VEFFRREFLNLVAGIAALPMAPRFAMAQAHQAAMI
jgi:hypothetical protein